MAERFFHLGMQPAWGRPILMSHRSFHDEVGRTWEVWEVVPTAVERRVMKPVSRPPTIERRKVREARVLVPEKLQRGWLAFQSGNERRRLAPIPTEWDEMTTAELVELLHQADRRLRARRLVE
jgi:hypothetical protein